MSVTKAQAIEELKRRGVSLGPTKEQAIAELKRRGAYQEPRSIGKSLAKGARNVAAGLMEIPDLLATPIREGLNLGAKALGSDYRFKPMSENVAEGIDRATEGYTAPETDQDKIIESVTRSLASLPAGGLMGKALAASMPRLGSVLKGSSEITPGNIGATAGSSALMQEALNENPDDTLAAIGSGLAGGIGGGLAGGLGGMTSSAFARGFSNADLPKGQTRTLGQSLIQGAKNVGHEAKELSRVTGEKLGNLIGIKPGRAEDFQIAGVNPLMADVTDSKIAKMMTHALERLPFTGKPIEQAKAVQRAAIEEGLDINNSLSRRRAGALASEGATSYKESKETLHNPIFAKIETDLERMPDTNVSVNHTMGFFEQLAKKNKNGLMDKKFAGTPVGKELNELRKEASIYAGEIPYESLKQTLDGINDKITTHGLIGKSSQGKLKHLADVIAQDIDASLETKFKALGGDAYSNWKKGRHLYREYVTNDVPNLNEMFKKDKKGAINLFEDLVGNNKVSGAKAKLIYSQLDEKDQMDLMNSFQKRLGSQADGPWSLAKWGTEFRKLDDEARDIILSPLNAANKKKVEAIADVVGHMKDTLREANSSGSGYYGTLTALGAAAWKAAESAVMDNFVPAASLGIMMLVGRLGAHALSNPKIINWAYQGMRSKDLSHYMRHLSRLEHMGGIHRTVKTEVQRFINDINEAPTGQQKHKPKITIYNTPTGQPFK